MKTGKISKIKVSKNRYSYILYDDSLIAEPTLQLFNRDYHTNQQTQQNNSASATGIGRARVVFFSLNSRALVLKHYFRGGAVASITKDRYLGVNIENTRAFKEWRLLNKMHHLGLPVPQAVAAHVEKALFTYRADLITGEIKQSKTLADVLGENGITEKQWSNIGACIRLFHQHDVYHADLNARNILLTGSDEVYLVDFDNSYFRAGSPSWKMANVARLKRSLLKFKKNTAGFNFNETNWSAFLNGYK